MKRRAIVYPGGGTGGEITQTVCAEMAKASGDAYFSRVHYHSGSSIGGMWASVVGSGLHIVQDAHYMCREGEIKTFREKNGGFPKYGFCEIEKIYRVNMPPNFKMGDHGAKVMITRESVTQGRTRYVKSYAEHEKDYSALDVVKSTIAAQTYFPSVDCYETQDTYQDGGSGINNTPLLATMREIGYLRSIDDAYDCDWHILVIGTGRYHKTVPFSKTRRYRWLRELWNYLRPKEGGLARSQSEDFQCDVGTDFVKFFDLGIQVDIINHDLKKEPKLDDIKVIPEYNRIGKQLFYDNIKTIERFWDD